MGPRKWAHLKKTPAVAVYKAAGGGNMKYDYQPASWADGRVQGARPRPLAGPAAYRRLISLKLSLCATFSRSPPSVSREKLFRRPAFQR